MVPLIGDAWIGVQNNVVPHSRELNQALPLMPRYCLRWLAHGTERSILIEIADDGFVYVVFA